MYPLYSSRDVTDGCMGTMLMNAERGEHLGDDVPASDDAARQPGGLS